MLVRIFWIGLIFFSIFLLQEAALKTFHISDDPNNFSISEATESGDNGEFDHRPVMKFVNCFL